MRSSQKKRGSYPQKFPKSSRNTPRPRRRTRKKDPRGCSRCPSHGLSGPCSRHSPSSGTVCLGRVVAMQHLFILPNTHSGCPPLKQPNVSFRSACRLDRRSLVCSREFGLRGRLGSKLRLQTNKNSRSDSRSTSQRLNGNNGAAGLGASGSTPVTPTSARPSRPTHADAPSFRTFVASSRRPRIPSRACS